MLRRFVAVFLVGSFAPPLIAQSGPVISGFVTATGTTQYRVNAVAVECNPVSTEERVHPERSATVRHGCPDRTLGESVSVFGHKDKESGMIHAAAVERDAVSDLAVDGFALIDKVLVPLTSSSGNLRADGLPLTIDAGTKLTFAQGSGLAADTVGTNVWVRYTGTLHPNGTVAAASLLFSPNVIGSSEGRLRAKTDFDAAAIRKEDRQTGVARFFLGPNGKRIPASHNQGAQERVTAVGQKLIPVYQRNMPSADPTKIDFRFQVVDDPKLHDTLCHPSGVIQIPEAFANSLPDDSELAAVLAACIAEVLEKQALRATPGNVARSAANLAGAAAGFFVPGLGFATSAITGKNASIAEHHRQQQIARTSLSYMHDAGFDVTQAPVAWWKLADRKSRGLADTHMPYLSQALYQTLATAYPSPTR